MNIVLHGESSAGEYRSLEFSNARNEDHGFACTATVASAAEFHAVDLEMIHAYKSDMLGFFEELGERHGVWPGAISWESEFHELEIAATRPKSKVCFALRLCWPPDYERLLEESIVFEPSKLVDLARQMSRFLDLREGSRFGRTR